MAIDRITGPNSLPLSTADYQAQNALIAAAILPGTLPFVGTDVKQGTVFNIGGILYKATSDTAISGTPSPYVKVTASGATASAAFVASLAGVAWNGVYNGYYDGLALVCFDEVLAYLDGVIVSMRAKFSGLPNSHILLGESINGKDETISSPDEKSVSSDGTIPQTVKSFTIKGLFQASLTVNFEAKISDISGGRRANVALTGGATGSWVGTETTGWESGQIVATVGQRTPVTIGLHQGLSGASSTVSIKNVTVQIVNTLTPENDFTLD